MRLFSRSVREARQRLRPNVELLEQRAIPALGLFIENFASDLDQSVPGWDSWDLDPGTLPPGPDELQIRNNFPAFPVTNGPTATGGYLAIEERTTPTDPSPYGPFVLSVLSVEGLPGFGSITFTLPDPGDPDGPLLGEEVAAVGLDIRGAGNVLIVGAVTQIEFRVNSPRDVAGNYVWEHLAVTRNTVVGQDELGGIRRIVIRAEPTVEINRITALVLDAEAPPPTVVIANDDSAIVSQRQRDPVVTFNWRQNDFQENGEPLTLVSHTLPPPLHGTLTMDDATGTGTFRPTAGFVGRTSFSYMITDPHGTTDTADVILDVTTNVAPVTVPFETFLDRALRLTEISGIIAEDLDGDVLTGELLRDVGHGAVTFTSMLEPDGRSTLRFRYYLPFGGTIKFNDSFAFRATDPAGEADEGIAGIMTDNTFRGFANDDFYAIPAGSPLPIDFDLGGVLEFDLPDFHPGEFFVPDPLHAELVSGPYFGQLTAFLGDGTFAYRPNPGFAGIDFFTYRVSDGDLTGNVATVQLLVDAEVPVAVNDDFVFTHPVDKIGWSDPPIYDVDSPGVMANDFLPTRPGRVWTVIGSKDSPIREDGGIHYRVLFDFLGARRYTYRYSSDPFLTRSAIVDLRVDAPLGSTYGDVPVGQNQTISLYSTHGHVIMNAHALTTLPDLPPELAVQFPYGFIQFDVGGIAPGGTARVTLTLPTGAPTPTSYYMFGREPDNLATPEDETVPHLYEFLYDGSTGAVINGRTITLHFVDGQRGDDDLLANGIIVDPGGPAYRIPPRVASVVVNDGAPQRSKVNKLTVTFSDLVTLDRGALEVLTARGKRLQTKVALTTVGDHSLATLTFKGNGTQAGSLVDGQYALKIDGAKIHDARGLALDGDGDGQPGGVAVEAFFRLFGDTDGDGDLDGSDHARLLAAMGRRRGTAGYFDYLDYDGDGKINAQDLVAFLTRRKLLTQTPLSL